MKRPPYIPPFVRIAPLFAAGILVADFLRPPLWGTAAAWITCFAFAAAWRRINAGRPYAALLTVLTAMMLMTVHLPRQQMPLSEKLLMTGYVSGLTEARGGRAETTVRIGRFRPDGGGRWEKCGAKILLSADTALAHELSPGRRFICRGYVNPFLYPGSETDERASDYAALMMRRGYAGRLWIGAGADIIPYGPPVVTPGTAAARLRAAAAERLNRLPLGEKAKQVCLTMSLGLRSGLDRGLREEYSRTGAAHLLAVSGLHVGIVALLANLLLGFLPLVRGGHRLKNILATAFIWVYAALAGLSPSTVRAAFMFTGIQVALAASEVRSALNVMLGTAVIMLALNPNALFDISFQLSFAAVLGITAFYMPLYRLIRCRWRAVNALSSAILVSVAATTATAPLVSLRFGSLPLAGVALSPALMLTATVIVFGSLLWIAMPFDALAGGFAWILQHAADAQNALVGFSAGKPWASLPVGLEPWQAVGAYAVLVTAGLLLARLPLRNKSLEVEV